MAHIVLRATEDTPTLSKHTPPPPLFYFSQKCKAVWLSWSIQVRCLDLDARSVLESIPVYTHYFGLKTLSILQRNSQRSFPCFPLSHLLLTDCIVYNMGICDNDSWRVCDKSRSTCFICPTNWARLLKICCDIDYSWWRFLSCIC